MTNFDLLKAYMRDYLEEKDTEPTDLVDAVTDVLAEIPGLEPVTEQLEDVAWTVMKLSQTAIEGLRK